MRKLCLSLILLAFVYSIYALPKPQKPPKPVSLWKDITSMRHQKAQLYLYPAPDSSNTKVSILICPGGSYSHLMGIKTEGYQVAEWLNKQGINAFVLRYRVGSKGYHHPAMIQDAQRAIQYIRENSRSLAIDPAKLGAMGFSAGGHLVTMTGVMSNDSFLQQIGVQSHVSLRPNFIVPVYPVVSMQDSIAHQRSRKNLLTKKYTKEQQDKFSMEQQITGTMPPTLLVAAKDDPVVMYQNSIALDKALTNNNIQHLFLFYPTGGHGFGMDENIAGDTALWRESLLRWLKEIKIINN